MRSEIRQHTTPSTATDSPAPVPAPGALEGQLDRLPLSSQLALFERLLERKIASGEASAFDRDVAFHLTAVLRTVGDTQALARELVAEIGAIECFALAVELLEQALDHPEFSYYGSARAIELGQRALEALRESRR
jgi:hypothetical protein